MKKAKGKSNISIVRDMLNGERPFTQVSMYQPEAEKPISERTVGEIWEDKKGKKWIKGEFGVRSYNPQADVIREEINKGYVCKRCEQNLRFSHTKHDKKMLDKTGMCFDCVIEYETELKFRGLFGDYAKNKILQNALSYALDMKQKLREGYKYTKENKVIKYVNSNGMVEEWENSSRTELMTNILNDYKLCLREIKNIKNEIKSIPPIPSPTELKKTSVFIPLDAVLER